MATGSFMTPIYFVLKVLKGSEVHEETFTRGLSQIKTHTRFMSGQKRPRWFGSRRGGASSVVHVMTHVVRKPVAESATLIIQSLVFTLPR
ncbi:hypothetical protein TNCV_3503711 [Trichonephila clavipes]|uniref:Uncharacterized protein n=1 Tax=Trichonephila clavipes TaxID=2585209 RepID=A0A8X6S0U7_TRICX|nr:hypothetical protein TNCV_3503711 [Trichonephila clavipes]